MALLLLLRHAKAGWAAPGMQDFDRALEPSGRADADAVGAAMRGAGLVPDRVLCSGARRTRETWSAVAQPLGLGPGQVVFTDLLYSADAKGYLDAIRIAEPVETLMVIGHNPMMEDLAQALSGAASDAARQRLASGFPTSGLAAIRFPGPLSEAGPGQGHLQAFIAPRDL